MFYWTFLSNAYLNSPLLISHACDICFDEALTCFQISKVYVKVLDLSKNSTFTVQNSTDTYWLYFNQKFRTIIRGIISSVFIFIEDEYYIRQLDNKWHWITDETNKNAIKNEIKIPDCADLEINGYKFPEDPWF